ncbi:GNAT family N-acetyltransferase [Aurantiacibacter xanthus]|uniref:GNAT family N-acetyltransferase n=1 Tax=Aurantiacibacter xanthus TaxID=1784712 RepID=A0A3A1P0U3_9SPHN|nr:GNAT family N-acetyltransferase [Aurantiacibacter xanthus]RIV82556.1 GNAT family N-acetyltransferase [Aurantiacibacter xanthus]
MDRHGVQIRPFDAAEDLAKLSAIWFAASLKAHSFIGEARLIEQRRLIEEEYLPKAVTFVACLDGQPVGFISLLGSFVGGIFVAPDRQGAGIGRKLIAHALDQTGELTLEVYIANTQAMAFYRKLGFRELSRRDIDDSGLPFPNATLRLDQPIFALTPRLTVRGTE